jgi:hypothetical protein
VETLAERIIETVRQSTVFAAKVLGSTIHPVLGSTIHPADRFRAFSYAAQSAAIDP